MRNNKKEKRRTRTAAARVIPALLLCVFLLGGGLLACFGALENPAEPVGSEPAVTEPAATEPAAPTVEEILAESIQTMSLEEKVGQMFLIRCPKGTVVNGVRKFQPGGMIFFSRDFKEKEPDQVRAEIASYQEVSRVPMLTAVDEEGGDVNRISWYSQYRSAPFAGPQQLYAEGGWERILSDTVEKCQLLADLGINVNMAPVCDMCDPTAYIYRRTIGKDAEGTSEYVRRVVRAMTEQNTGSVLKHFPGYGDNSDTHAGFSVDSRPYSQFEERDFLPFAAGMKAGAGAVLVSHNIVSCMDDEYPASLSAEVHRVLREELDFEGVIMTDDLIMSAITETYGTAEAAVLAVKAGNDMLCCSDYKTQIPAVLDAVRSGEISEERIDRSVLRILLWKHSLGLLD